ncbi:hypothetical protein MMC14_008247 [Varicellaria rhodocarpa]|nr:hypothetical protein [Varicellaria rhodocarpa]
MNQELKISFNNPALARAYQSKNPEARIFADEGEANVWLPISTSVRASHNGFTVTFDTKNSTEVWCKKSLLGEQGVFSSNDFEVYFTGNDLKTKLGLGKAIPQSQPAAQFQPAPQISSTYYAKAYK